MARIGSLYPTLERNSNAVTLIRTDDCNPTQIASMLCYATNRFLFSSKMTMMMIAIMNRTPSVTATAIPITTAWSVPPLDSSTVKELIPGVDVIAFDDLVDLGVGIGIGVVVDLVVVVNAVVVVVDLEVLIVSSV